MPSIWVRRWVGSKTTAVPSPEFSKAQGPEAPPPPRPRPSPGATRARHCRLRPRRSPSGRARAVIGARSRRPRLHGSSTPEGHFRLHFSRCEPFEPSARFFSVRPSRRAQRVSLARPRAALEAAAPPRQAAAQLGAAQRGVAPRPAVGPRTPDSTRACWGWPTTPSRTSGPSPAATRARARTSARGSPTTAASRSTPGDTSSSWWAAVTPPP